MSAATYTTLLPDWFLGAELSVDRKYRYRLWRRWAKELPVLFWIMLNPSTADEWKDDATIRRCVNFSRRWGFGGMEIYNLFAFRTAYPVELRTNSDPVGPANDSYLRTIPEDGQIVVAWGAFDYRLGNRDKDVLVMLGERRVDCLGMTVQGYPRHPVRLSNEAVREPYLKPRAAHPEQESKP